MDDTSTPPGPDNDVPANAPPAAESTTVGSILSSPKTHLAIGVAATLGVMIFYKWRDRQMAEKEPEEYARLQRIKASVLNGEVDPEADEDAFDPDQDNPDTGFRRRASDPPSSSR